MAKTLNREMPFAEVHGDAGGVRYVQNNVPFDHNGREVVTDDDKPKKPVKSMQPPEPVPSLPGLDIDAQLEKQL